MLKRPSAYEHGWYVMKSSDKLFSHYTDHVTNQVHIPINVLTLCVCNLFHYLYYFYLNSIYRTALIKLVWEVLGEDLAKLLGYKSHKGLQSCLERNDHHKAVQFCEILLFCTGCFT